MHTWLMGPVPMTTPKAILESVSLLGNINIVNAKDTCTSGQKDSQRWFIELEQQNSLNNPKLCIALSRSAVDGKCRPFFLSP